MASKTLPMGIKFSNISRILRLGGYVKVRESFVYLSYYLGHLPF